jgi:hypothetical protein
MYFGLRVERRKIPVVIDPDRHLRCLHVEQAIVAPGAVRYATPPSKPDLSNSWMPVTTSSYLCEPASSAKRHNSRAADDDNRCSVPYWCIG